MREIKFKKVKRLRPLTSQQSDKLEGLLKPIEDKKRRAIMRHYKNLNKLGEELIEIEEKYLTSIYNERVYTEVERVMDGRIDGKIVQGQALRMDHSQDASYYILGKNPKSRFKIPNYKRILK